MQSDMTSTARFAPRDSLDALPTELQAVVLRGVQWSARATCTAFRYHVESQRSALHLRLPTAAAAAGAAATDSFTALTTFLSRLPRLVDIAFAGCSTACLPALARVLHPLSSLTLRSSTTLTSLAPLSFAACTALTCLDLTGCWRVTTISALADCHSLRWLSLSHNRQLADLAPLSTCPSLTTLSLAHCSNVQDLSPLAACPLLSGLNLDDCQSLSDLTPLAACSHLSWVKLRCCPGIGDVLPLAALPALTRLELAYSGNVSDEDVDVLQACTCSPTLRIMR